MSLQSCVVTDELEEDVPIPEGITTEEFERRLKVLTLVVCAAIKSAGGFA